MARKYGGNKWQIDNQHFMERVSDEDSPTMAYRYRYRRYSPYVRDYKTEEKRRTTLSYLIRFFLISTAMILFCALMYIPVYNKANHYTKGIAGWSIRTNRDTKIYVRPNNVTTVHTPKDICPETDRLKKHSLFLLIIVCSATNHFETRQAIRDTWGDYTKYEKIKEINAKVREKYKNYNFTQNLYPELNQSGVNFKIKVKRDLSSFNDLLPELAKALQKNLDNEKVDDKVREISEASDEKRFEDDEEEDDAVISDFDMNKELDNQEVLENYDYSYDSNIMKIPPNGFEETPNLEKVLSLLKLAKNFNLKETAPDFKLVFILGLPQDRNDTELQDKIEEEVEKYGDIIQEGFIDSYNNLTLKSIMMLKWITYNCNQSVRYILKTDDDMFINVPNLVRNLKNRSETFDAAVEGFKRNEYLLIGDLICGARPVHNSQNKWYSPRYMYGGHVYPRYLSGTGYVMSALTAHSLYEAALRTNYFHLEDVYITGMCAYRAHPRIPPRDDPGFSYRGATASSDVCSAHAHATLHRVTPTRMRHLHQQLLDVHVQELCERQRLSQVRIERMRQLNKTKKTNKKGRLIMK